MTNLEKYNRAFIRNLDVTEDELLELKYRGIPQWDSIGHMDLIAELEGEFEIRMETSDVLAFSSYKKGKEVLAEYGVILE
ncbi:Uncharacterised protein [uncultured Roseburia sp.]|uniref:Acyl carrier protein n=1 Tax=Brotonthovivens ammoniilytica TaxID=2981725 RepID=A0ABT2TJF8_9FIRM|nr:acyl carrier protein [Brotonthovivens ammoniilytica]MCU6762354.1 acyl carrier protein [Brotonthovivens ammoniilytica]SCI69110.1 Uncharacterised protein [uncultured Roseburia sp.]